MDDFFKLIFAILVLASLASIDESLKKIADKEFITYDTQGT